MRPTLIELERRSQKPAHRTIGNWMARRVARPLALRVTWVILPLGLSAHAATLIAWLTGLCAVAAFGWGSPAGWLLGAVLLQLWYVLDHVDGQLARYQGTASLDGVQLDYVMHHSLNLLVPFGVGWGLSIALINPLLTLCGLAWGLALLMIGLLHDARYKAFFQRLKRVQGELRLIGGGGGRPQAQPSVPWQPVRFAAWLARKACEMHVLMNGLLLLTAARWMWPWALEGLVYGATAISGALGVAILARSLQQEEAEQEFARWFLPPTGEELEFQEGYWIVHAAIPNERGARHSPASCDPPGCE